MRLKSIIRKNRKPAYPITPLILNRYSPRALSGKKITKKELMQLFEAARWAPSSYNNQPWRFIYSTKGSKHWNKFFSLLSEGNKAWCKNASALAVVVSRTKFEHNNKPTRTHSFDAGAAWENLALEATHKGIIAHGMEGFDYEKTRRTLKIPKDFEVEMMIAIGMPGRKSELPVDYRKGETPNSRKPLKELVMEGEFRK